MANIDPCVYLKERAKERDLPFVGLFPKFLQWPGLDQADVWSQELRLSLSHGWQDEPPPAISAWALGKRSFVVDLLFYFILI